MRGLLSLCFILGVFLQASHSNAADEAKVEDDDKIPMMEAEGKSEDEITPDVDTVDGEGEEEDLDSVWTDEQLTSEQVTALHKKVDANGDGKVSLKEILEFSDLAKKAIVAKETTELLDSMDLNKDGKISVDELVEGTFGAPMPEDVKMPPPATEEEKAEEEKIKKEKELEQEKFKVADKNKDGFLDKDELPAAFYPETHEGVLALTAAAALKARDTDGDGELSPKEFWHGEDPDDHDNEELRAEQKSDFEKLDLDKNGKLNLNEFKKWESGAYHTEDAMTALMEIADEDGDGHITSAELDKARPVVANSMATSMMQEWVAHHEL